MYKLRVSRTSGKKRFPYCHPLPRLQYGRAGRELRRRRGRLPLLTAPGVGLTAGMAALLCGALVPAGVGLVDSALSLAALADLACYCVGDIRLRGRDC